MSPIFVSSLSSVLVVVLGASTMAAWWLGLRDVVQLHPEFAPIQFNTALCLALVGVALLRSSDAWRPVSVAAAAIVAVISGMTATEYLLRIDLGVDQLFVDASFTPARTLSLGRMSPQTTSAYLLVASILFASAYTDRRRRAAVLGFGGGLVGCYALTSAIGYASAVYETSGWLGFTRVSPQAAVGFFLVATTMVARAWAAREPGRLPGWVVPAVISTCWVVGLLLFIGLRQLESSTAAEPLLDVMLGSFLLLGVAFGVALVQYRRTAAARQSALASKEQVESLLAQTIRTELVASLALENTRQGVWDLDLITGKTSVDDGFRSILGRDPAVEPLRDDTWTRAIHEDDITAVRARLRANMDGNDLFEAQFRVKAASGEWLWVDSRGRVVERNAQGLALRMVGTLRDITEQQRNRERLQQAEEALRDAKKMEAIGRLAGGVAHHINNKMMVVLGHAELLAAASDDPHQQASASKITDAATDAANICRQLLAHGRRQILQPRPFDADLRLSRLANEFREALRGKARLELSLSSSPRLCYADATQIEWAITSLIDNAREAVGQDGVVRINTSVVEVRPGEDLLKVDPGRYVSIAIMDNGGGFPPQVAEHLFEPFYTTKDVAEVQGLGLATCYGIVRQSNGILSVASVPGRGTTFTMLLPCAPEGAADAG